MKKIVLLIISLLFIVNVNAQDKIIKLVTKDDKVVYESNLDEDVFINHLSVGPGESYTDSLRITNESGKQVKLFLKVKLLEQSASADNLLDNITMKVYLDNNLIYNGKAKGLDYNSLGVNLQNAVELKTYNSGDSSILKVETGIAYEFDDPDADLSKFRFVLYGQYDDKSEEIIPVPITDDYTIPYWVISLIICLVGVGMVIISKKIDNKKGGKENAKRK